MPYAFGLCRRMWAAARPVVEVLVGLASKVAPSSSRTYFGCCWFASHELNTKLGTTPIDFCRKAVLLRIREY